MYSFTEIANHFEQNTTETIKGMTFEQLSKVWVKTWDMHEEAYLEEDTDTCVKCGILMDAITEIQFNMGATREELQARYWVPID